MVKLPALAETLRTIAAKGPKAFYEGAIAEDMVATLASAARSSPWTISAASRRESSPITTNYRGLDIFELPPNTQGLTALVLLNILERFELAALDPLGPERFHIALEAARLAYGVRDAHVADPMAMRISTKALLDKGFAAELAGTIDPGPRVCPIARPVSRQRYRLPCRGRPRPHGRLLDQFALFQFSASASARKGPASC